VVKDVDVFLASAPTPAAPPPSVAEAEGSRREDGDDRGRDEAKEREDDRAR
jgi:hypothetical protein